MRIVVIGNGIAALRILMLLYKEAKEGLEVTLVCKEKYGPYSRMRLPDYIKGDLKEAFFKSDVLAQYEAKGLKAIRGNEAVSIDRAQKEVVLSDGSRVAYDSLIIATGAEPRRLPIEGGNLEGIMTLRTVEDAERIMADRKRSVLVIGGGLLGLEVAHAVEECYGRPVTVLETAEYLLPRQFDKDSSMFLEKLLSDKGLRFIKGRTSVRFTSSDGKRADALLLGDGTEVKADLFLEAVGVVPNVELARAAGLTVSRAVVIDERARTSDPDIYAAGDVAEFEGICPGLVSFANETGRVAASCASGIDAQISLPVSSAYISVAGIECYSVGNIREYASCLVKTKGDRYEAYYVDADGSLAGSVSIGSRENMMKASSMVGKPFDISIAAWADR